MSRLAAQLAARTDDGDIIDNEALAQPFRFSVKKRLQCVTTMFESSCQLVLDRKSLKP